MAKTKSLGLADLDKLMQERQAKLETLLQRREELEAEVERLDGEIQDFLTPGGRRIPGRKRPHNAASLRTVLLGILAKNRKGLSLEDLAQKISETGYKSQSNNFKNIVYQCVYKTKNVVHDKATGLYRVTK